MKKIKIIYGRDGGEIIFHYPNGAVQFLGFWASIKLIFLMLKNNIEFDLVDYNR